MEAHHLLYVYLSVWIIQGGYCAWIAGQWLRERKHASAAIQSSSNSREDF
jgi:hypothetical protein